MSASHPEMATADLTDALKVRALKLGADATVAVRQRKGDIHDVIVSGVPIAIQDREVAGTAVRFRDEDCRE